MQALYLVSPFSFQTSKADELPSGLSPLKGKGIGWERRRKLSRPNSTTEPRNLYLPFNVENYPKQQKQRRSYPTSRQPATAINRYSPARNKSLQERIRRLCCILDLQHTSLYRTSPNCTTSVRPFAVSRTRNLIIPDHQIISRRRLQVLETRS